MSTTDQRLPLSEALTIAQELADMLSPYCERFEIAGSIRREKTTIGDIELVAIPKQRDLWNRLDKLVYDGRVSKALYVDKNGKSSYRWGDIYRGIFYKGIKAEIFTADIHNWGYQLWLRTGSGDANEYIMTMLTKGTYPLKFGGGYAHYTPSRGEPVKLSICDEKTLFTCLGMNYVKPKYRSPHTYELEWTGKIEAYTLLQHRAPTIQPKLF